MLKPGSLSPSFSLSSWSYVARLLNCTPPTPTNPHPRICIDLHRTKTPSATVPRLIPLRTKLTRPDHAHPCRAPVGELSSRSMTREWLMDIPSRFSAVAHVTSVTWRCFCSTPLGSEQRASRSWWWGGRRMGALRRLHIKMICPCLPWWLPLCKWNRWAENCKTKSTTAGATTVRATTRSQQHTSLQGWFLPCVYLFSYFFKMKTWYHHHNDRARNN